MSFGTHGNCSRIYIMVECETEYIIMPPPGRCPLYICTRGVGYMVSADYMYGPINELPA